MSACPIMLAVLLFSHYFPYAYTPPPPPPSRTILVRFVIFDGLPPNEDYTHTARDSAGDESVSASTIGKRLREFASNKRYDWSNVT